MRIITGSAKGCRLKAPKGLATRPTADRVKESVFNILSNAVMEAEVLDIFAGTGNLGLEALSRGAAKAVFVDKSSESIKIIKENAEQTRLVSQTEIIKGDVIACLERLARQAINFDLVFCDPPYSKGLVQQSLLVLDRLDILNDEALLVIEHDSKDDINLLLEHINLIRSERYGATTISFFRFNKNKRNAKLLEED